MDKEKMKRLQASMAQINKRYGANTVMRASDAAAQGKLTKKIIPTPSLELNDALHCGGFSGIVELYGPNSSGKTSLAIDTLVKNQKLDPNFVGGWLETEGSVTEQMLADHGVDLDRLIYWRQEDVGNAENALDILRGFVVGGDIDMIVVNSVAGLAPKTETEDDLEKQNIALTARLLSKFFRVVNGFAAKNDITLVFINQIRDNVGQMFGDTSTTTGGKALAFYASQRIKMNRNKIMAADPIKEEDGVKISCIVHKNRFAGKNNPFTKCIYYATYANGIDSVIPMPTMLLEAGIMRQAGAWWYYEDAQGQLITIDGIAGKFSSKNNFLDVLRTNEKWYNEMLTRLGGGLATVQSAEEMAEAEAENAEINALMDEVNRIEAADDINEILEQNDQ
jgi:recombination protein RecA